MKDKYKNLKRLEMAIIVAISILTTGPPDEKMNEIIQKDEAKTIY